MPIYDNLKDIKTRNENGTCDFNGYIEDYVGKDESISHKDILEQILSIDESLRVIVGLYLDIKDDVITNRIIRYKDAFKVMKDAIYYPIVVYGKNADGEDRAVILCDDTKIDYILAKGLYYCMSEPNSIFDRARNEMVSCSFKDAKEVCQKVFMENVKTGSVQRKLDAANYSSYDDLFEICEKHSSLLKENISNEVHGMNEENRQKKIKEYIVTIFLLKKIVYVQYMMNKAVLNELHHGDIKEQRAKAKENADSISFYSFAELWKL